MPTTEYLPSPAIETLTAEMQKNQVSQETIETVRNSIFESVDLAVRNAKATNKDDFFLAGCNAGMDILWEKGHPPEKVSITYVALLTHEYVTHVMKTNN